MLVHFAEFMANLILGSLDGQDAWFPPTRMASWVFKSRFLRSTWLAFWMVHRNQVLLESKNKCQLLENRPYELRPIVAD